MEDHLTQQQVERTNNIMMIIFISFITFFLVVALFLTGRVLAQTGISTTTRPSSTQEILIEPTKAELTARNIFVERLVSKYAKLYDSCKNK